MAQCNLKPEHSPTLTLCGIILPMARTLSETLIEAQKVGLIRYPYLIAKIKRRWGGVIRHDYEQLYSGSEQDNMHAAAMPSDGSLIRLRVGTPPNNNRLHYSRVVGPDENSDYSQWVDTGIDNVWEVASIAEGTHVAQFYISSNLSVYFRESDDCGETWGAWGTIDTVASSVIYGLDAAYKPNLDLCVVWENAGTLYAKRRLSSVWQAKSANPNALANKTGASVCYHSDWNIVVTYGTTDAEKGTCICLYGDGGSQAVGTWSSYDNIITRSPTDPYMYRSPCVRRTDTTRLFFMENLMQAEILYHIYYSHSPPAADFVDNAWLEPVPMDMFSIYGVSFSYGGSYVWLTNSSTVYRALATDDELDIADKLLRMDMRQYPDIRKGYVRIDIDNVGGIYNDFDRIGQELTIGLGFVTAAGNEYSLTSSFWITKQKLVSPSWSIWRSIYPSGVLGVLNVEAQDAWDFLKRYKARRTLSWAADEKSVVQLLQYFLARSGLDFEIQSSSDAANNFKPEFQVSKGTLYRTIVKNLLKMIPDQLIFREAKAILRNPTTAEAVDWVYHNTIGTAILVFRGEYGASAQDPNRAEVWGDTFMKQDADYPQIQKVRDRGVIITTPDYPDLTRAGERAAAELRRAEILTSEESWMQTTVNCGLEPWDKLQITDQASGVADIIRRAIRLRTKWDKLSWNYHQTLGMGAD